MTTTTLRPIEDIGDELRLPRDHYVPFGEGAAKLLPAAAFPADTSGAPAAGTGKLVLVSAITPTPAGEGKTTMSISLADGLRRRGKRALAALRQPSLGPTLGSKGGGAGGGRARLEPFERINLGLTGDINAVTAAHNLLASLIDNLLHFGAAKSPPGAPVLDPRRVDLPRVIDLDDRTLRQVVVGLGGALNGLPRETRFDITAASEVMAILCLARDYADLKARLGRILVGAAVDDTPVNAAAIGAVGGMAVVLREAMLPNLLQTHEGTPALVHGGPFGNIAHGCSSVVATRFALRAADIVVTEAGFGFDLGAEKFLDIKCRAAGIWPDALLLVATAKALKFHGGVDKAKVAEPNLAALRLGAENLRRHLETARAFGLSACVAINVFPGDSPDELAEIERIAAEEGCPAARVTAYSDGAEGALALADMMIARLGEDRGPKEPRYLYELTDPLRVKIEKVARTVYGATGVEFAAAAERDLKRAELVGLGQAPVCIAKTHLSLSADPTAGGRPRPHVLPVRAVRLSAGAGFVVPLCGEIMTMPGLGSRPAVLGMDLSDDGRISGLK